MPTQAELEEFMATRTPEQIERFAVPGRKKRVKSPAEEAADLLARQQAGGQTVQPHLGGGTPGSGVRLEFDQPSTSTPVAQVMESKIDSSGLDDIEDTSKYGVAGIPDVTDRFQGQFDAAKQALSAYDDKYISRSPFEEGSTKYNPRAYQRRVLRSKGSAERSNLIREYKSAERLLREGSFADKSNLTKEQRQAQAATASNLIADANLKQQEFDFGEVEKALRGKQTTGTKRSTITSEIYNELVKSLLSGSN